MMLNTFETGGSERQFVAITNALRHRHFDIQLGCVARLGPLLEKVANVEEFSLGGSFLTLRAQRSRAALGRYLKREKVQIVHSFDFYTNLLLLPTARFVRVPVVIGSHRQLGDLLTPRQFRAQGVAFWFCDRVVCNSRAASERLIRQGLPERKVAIIPNGLGPELFASAVPALPVSRGTVRVGMIARMNTRSKNHGVFLRAAKRLASKLPNVQFLVVGDGPLRSEIEDTARDLGLADRICFLGDRRDIPELLASLDISVVPSDSESMSNVILESMAAGVGVVATNVGGTPEIISEGDTGLLVQPGRDDQLAAAIERFLTQPHLRAACASKGKELASTQFSLESVAERYEALYEEVLASKSKQDSGVRRFSVSSAHGLRPLRVAIVGPSHRYVGGQSVQVEALLRNWRNDQDDVKVRFIAVDREMPHSLRWVERVPFLRTIVRQPFYWLSLWKQLKEEDIAHVFSASYWSFILAPAPAYWMAKARKKKVLVHYHSGEAPDHLRRSRVARRILKRADCVVVPSAYLVEVFEKFALHAKAIANVVDMDQFSFRSRIPLQPRLICSRGFHPYYAVEDVVRAFGVVQEKHPGAVLYLLGSGPSERETRKLVKSLHLYGVEFTGPVRHHEIAGYYEKADIFVNASRLDNMPVSILEAFACGTPVVTTGAGGIRFVVEHERTGLLCEPGEWQLIAEYILRLLREPELAHRLSANAREESKRYRWESVRGEWLATYRSL
ncbi:MAG: glycosyltransferase family 4 protein [Candidatus Acidiferrales bacterium]